MKATFFCNECEATIDINAERMPELVLCPSCNFEMEELKTSLEVKQLAQINDDTKAAVDSLLTQMYAGGVTKIGTTTKERRKVIREVLKATSFTLRAWGSFTRTNIEGVAEADKK